jgi:hypothetical protein
MIPSLIPIFLYLAKMTAISAIFYIYYGIFLRNSPRHGYNRSYLLGTMTLALLIPLLRLPLPASVTTAIHQADLFIQSIPATPVAIVTAKRGPSAVAWLMAHRLSVYCVIAYAGVACLFSGHQVAPGRELMHFYLRHLRYPAAAIQEGLEQTESFSLRIGEHNQLLEFKPTGAEQPGDSINTGRITIKARAVARTVGTGSSPLPEDKKDVFVEELRTVSSSISTDTTVTYPPGEYAFTIKFRLEPAQ